MCFLLFFYYFNQKVFLKQFLSVNFFLVYSNIKTEIKIKYLETIIEISHSNFIFTESKEI